MNIFVVGATGVLGRALVPLLMHKGYCVRALARTPEKARTLELAGVEPIEGDLLAPETAKQLPVLMKDGTVAVHIATAISRDMRAPGCIGCLAHPFEKEGLWAVIASLFLAVRYD